MGRPTKYKPEMCEQVIECGKEGKTLAEMAADLNVDRATINDWVGRHPEFSRAVKAGVDAAQAWWEGQGRVATFGGIEGYNATSYIFQMKNRFREDWNDTIKQEHTGKDGGPITTEDRSREKALGLLSGIAERSGAGSSASD